MKPFFSGALSIYIRSYQCAWHTGADLTHVLHKICHPQLIVYTFSLALVRSFFTLCVFFWFYFHFSFCQNCRFPVAPIHHWLQPFNSSRGTQPPPTSSPLYEQKQNHHHHHMTIITHIITTICLSVLVQKKTIIPLTIIKWPFSNGSIKLLVLGNWCN